MNHSEHRRRLLFAGAALGLSTRLCAQSAGRQFRVGHLSGSGQQANAAMLDAFLKTLAERGYLAGKNMIFEERYADGRLDKLPALARELVERQPDVLLVATTPGALAVKAAASSIPIVFVLVADPVGAGIVPSLSRQGGNITGVTPIVAELGGKRLEILKEIFPKSAQFAVMVNPGDQNTPLQMRYAEEGARRLDVQLDPILEVRQPGDLQKAFEAATRAKAVAALRMADPLLFILRRQAAELEVKHRLPTIYPFPEDAEAGGLLAYGASTAAQFRQAGLMVDKILRGAAPSSIPVEQPTNIGLTINLRTAKAMGVAIPASLRLRADTLIE